MWSGVVCGEHPILLAVPCNKAQLHWYRLPISLAICAHWPTLELSCNLHSGLTKTKLPGCLLWFLHCYTHSPDGHIIWPIYLEALRNHSQQQRCMGSPAILHDTDVIFDCCISMILICCVTSQQC